MNVPFLRTPYNYDRDQVSDETGLSCGEPSLTQQQFVEESDINTIVSRFGLEPYGPMPPAEALEWASVDFSQVGDYRTCLDALRTARDGFMGLPADVRRRFDHDPAQLLYFLEDPANRDEAVRMGLVVPPPPPPPAPQVPQEPAK